jgi:hypothetical protein
VLPVSRLAPLAPRRLVRNRPDRPALSHRRWVTGSTILTMPLHGLINFEGMLETFVGLHA